MDIVNENRQQREGVGGARRLPSTRDMPVTYARPARHLVVFEIDRQSYAFPIDPVEQIIEMVTITPIPQVNSHLEGIINVRGIVVPVVNLGLILGYAATKSLLHTPIILVWVRGRMVGLIVEQVIDVIYVTGEQIIDPIEMLPEGLGDTPLLAGVVRNPGRTVLLLDLDRLFTSRRAGLAETLAAFTVIDESVDDENLLSRADLDAEAGEARQLPEAAAEAAGHDAATAFGGDGGDGDAEEDGRDTWAAPTLVRRKLAARRRTFATKEGDNAPDAEEPNETQV